MRISGRTEYFKAIILRRHLVLTIPENNAVFIYKEQLHMLIGEGSQ